jgi:hypothetical protein
LFPLPLFAMQFMHLKAVDRVSQRQFGVWMRTNSWGSLHASTMWGTTVWPGRRVRIPLRCECPSDMPLRYRTMAGSRTPSTATVNTLELIWDRAGQVPNRWRQQ